MCHGLPDLPTNDHPVDDHLSIHRPCPLSAPRYPLGLIPVSHQDYNQVVANFPPKPCSHHQMSPLVTSHPCRTVSRHNPCIKVTLSSLDSQSLGRCLSRGNILKTCTTPLDFTASLLVSTIVAKLLCLFYFTAIVGWLSNLVFTETLIALPPCFNRVRQEPRNHHEK